MIDIVIALYEKYKELLNSPSLAKGEMEGALAEIQTITRSKEFKTGIQDGSIDIKWAGKLKRLEDEIKEIMEERDFQDKATDNQNINQDISIVHDPKSDKLMQNADDLYWKGNWKEAYDLYTEVIKIEPNWTRAQEYVQKAKYNYENSVSIPKIAIPDSVRLAFSRAESALSRWDLDKAKEHLDIALSEAAKNDLSAWGELNDLQYSVENSIDIHNSYQAALLIPNINEAIEKIELAYQQSYRPLYKQKLDELKMEQDKLQTLQTKFRHGLQLTGEGKFAQAIELLSDVVSQYPENQDFIDGLNRAQKASDRQKEYENCVQNARLEMSLAHFQQALDWLNRAKELNAASMSKLKDLIEVSQTAIEIQNKYYELMGRGRQYMDSEDFQSAMEAFREASDLTQNPLPTEKLLLAEGTL